MGEPEVSAPLPELGLLPCPFCGAPAEFERKGNSRHSCIVNCTYCGGRHESGDEHERSGTSWNQRSDAALRAAEEELAEIFALAAADTPFATADGLRAVLKKRTDQAKAAEERAEKAERERADLWREKRELAGKLDVLRAACSELRDRIAEREAEIAGLQRRLTYRDQQALLARKYWVRAAEKALAGDTLELANRVKLAKAPPLELELSDDALPAPPARESASPSFEGSP